MNITEVLQLNPDTRTSLMQLWNKEYPVQLQWHDLAGFDTYLAGLEKVMHLLVTDSANQLAGWAFSFERESETWFAVIIDQSVQKQGLGTKLLAAIKARNKVLNGWVIDHDRDRTLSGAAYRSPLSFYLKNGFIVVPGIHLTTEKISAVKIRFSG